ncbi:MarR family winged helix-turn-helix transcriptional regulator [Nocardioides panacisoli]
MSGKPVLAEEVMAASRVITAAVVRSLSAVDQKLTVPQLRVLVMVSAAQGLSVNAVAQGLGVNASNASRTCERLVTSGLVFREESADDRRRVVLNLSPAGKRLVDSVMKVRRNELLGVVARMAPADRRTLAESLRAFNVAAAMSEGQDSPDHPDQHLLAWLD